MRRRFLSFPLGILLAVLQADAYIPLFDGRTPVPEARSTSPVLNAGFEEGNADGPTAWQRSGIPLYIRGATDAADGQAYARVGAEHRYAQRVAASPGLAHAVRLWCRGLRDGQSAETSDWIPVSRSWHPIADSLTPTSAAHTVSVRALWLDEWLDADGFEVLDELLDNADFEVGHATRPVAWQGNGTWTPEKARDGLASVRVGTRDLLWQDVAVEPGDKRYFLAGAVTANPPAEASVSLVWLRYDGVPVRRDAVRIAALAEWVPFCRTMVPPGYGRFAFDESQPAQSVLCRIELGCGTDQGTVIYDALAFGWLVAVPGSISPDGDGFRDTTVLSWVAPQEREWQVDIVAPDGGACWTAVVPAEAGAVKNLSWDGRNAAGEIVAAGTYTVRLLAPAGAVPFSVTTEVVVTPALSSTPFRRFEDWLPLGVWYNVPFYRVPPAEEVLRDFCALARAGFNSVYVVNFAVAPDELFFDAARQTGLRLFYGPSFFPYNQFARHAYGDIPPEQVRVQVQNLLRRAGDVSILEGLIIHDEPRADVMPVLEVYARVLADQAPDFPPIAVSDPPSYGVGFHERTRSPVFLADIYPVWAFEPVGGFRDHMQRLLKGYDVARNAGVPAWIMYNTYSDHARSRFATPAERRRVVYEAIATGYQGFFYFFANALSWGRGNAAPHGLGIAAGLLDHNGAFTDPEVAVLNGELARLAPLILDWRPIQETILVSPDLSAARLRSSTGTDYLVVVNRECVVPVVAQVSLPSSTYSVAMDVLTGERLPMVGWSVQMDLGPGEGLVLRLETEGKTVAQRTARSAKASDIPVVIPLLGRALNSEQRLSRLDTNGRVLAVKREMRSDGSMPLFLLDVSNPRRMVRGMELHTYRADRLQFQGDDLWLSDAGAGVVIYRVDTAERATESARLLHQPGNAMGIAVEHDRVFVAAQSDGFRVLRRDGSGALQVVAQAAGEVTAHEVAVIGGRLLALSGTGPSGLYDISALPRVQFLRLIPDLTHVRDCTVHGARAYVAAADEGLVVVDPHALPGAEVVHRLNAPDATGIAVGGEHLLVACRGYGLRVYRLSPNGVPQYMRSVVHEAQGTVDDVAVSDGTVFMCSQVGGVYAAALDAVLDGTSQLRLR